MMRDARDYLRGYRAVLMLQLRDWGWRRGWRMAHLWALYGVQVSRDARKTPEASR